MLLSSQQNCRKKLFHIPIFSLHYPALGYSRLPVYIVDGDGLLSELVHDVDGEQQVALYEAQHSVGSLIPHQLRLLRDLRRLTAVNFDSLNLD